MPPSGRNNRNGYSSSKAPIVDDIDDSGTNISINTSQILGRKNNRLNDLLKKNARSTSTQKNAISRPSSKDSNKSSHSTKRKSTFEEDDGFVFKRRPESKGEYSDTNNIRKTKMVQEEEREKAPKKTVRRTKKTTPSNLANPYIEDPEIKDEEEGEYILPKTQSKSKTKPKPKAKPKSKPKPKPTSKTAAKKTTKKSIQSEQPFQFEMSSPFKSNPNKKQKVAVSSPPSPPESSPTFMEQVSSHQITLPLTDTPINRRNQELRNGKRRSSLGNRGKRVSSIGNGFTAAPHSDVPPQDYYKLLDTSLPEPHKMRQLLIWCFKRVLERDNERITQDKKLGNIRNNDDTTVINIAKVIKDELIHDLVNGKLNTSWYNRFYEDDNGVDDESSGNENNRAVKLLPNTLNLTNETNIRLFENRLQALKEEGAKWESSFIECLEPASKLSISMDENVGPSESAAAYTDVLNQSILKGIESTKDDLTMDLSQNLEHSIDSVYDLTHKLNSTSKIINKFNEKNLKKLTSVTRNYVNKDQKFKISDHMTDGDSKTEVQERVLDTKELLKGITRLDKGD